MNYIDDYSACERTYATLRIYPDSITPDEVSKLLGLKPTRTSLAGAKSKQHVNGWFLSTQGQLESRDCRKHIDWLLDQIELVQTEFIELLTKEVRVDIFCFWVSSTGNGGPTISPLQMSRLVKFNLTVSWDIWLPEQN